MAELVRTFSGVLLACTLLLLPAAAAAQAPPDGRLIMAPDGSLYVMQDGQRHAIEPMLLSAAEIAAIPEGAPVPNNTIALASGGASATGFTGEIGPLSFGTAVDENGQVPNPARRFPAGTKEIYASFTATGVTRGEKWTSLWLRDGKEDVKSEFTWDPNSAGREWTRLFNENGIIEGNYEYRVVVGDEVLQLGFITVGNPATTGSLSDLAFATEVDPNTLAPLSPGTSFPAGTKQFYATFKVKGVPEGASFGWRALLNGKVWMVGDFAWEARMAVNGQTWLRRAVDEGALPEGKYDIIIVLNSAPQLRGTFTIGGRS